MRDTSVIPVNMTVFYPPQKAFQAYIFFFVLHVRNEKKRRNISQLGTSRNSRYFKITFGVSYEYAGFRTTTSVLAVSDQAHHFANFKKTNELY